MSDDDFDLDEWLADLAHEAVREINSTGVFIHDTAAFDGSKVTAIIRATVRKGMSKAVMSIDYGEDLYAQAENAVKMIETVCMSDDRLDSAGAQAIIRHEMGIAVGSAIERSLAELEKEAYQVTDWDEMAGSDEPSGLVPRIRYLRRIRREEREELATEIRRLRAIIVQGEGPSQ